MGAYENPNFVDESRAGLVWANVMNNISQQTTDYIQFTKQKDNEEAARVQKILDETAEYAINRQNDVYNNLYKLKANPQLFEEVSKLLDEETNAYLNMRNSSDPALRKKYLEKQNIYSTGLGKLYGLLNDGIESNAFYAETYDPVLAGGPGGISRTQPGIDKYVEGMSVRTGTKEGTQSLTMDESGNWIINIKDNSGKTIVNEPAELFFNYTPTLITDLPAEIKKIYASNGISNEDGYLSEQYQSKENEFIYGAKGIVQFRKKINAGKVATVVGGQLNAKVQALIEDPLQAEAIWGVIRTKDDPEKINIAKLLSDEKLRMKFYERFNSFAAELLPVSEASKAFDYRNFNKTGGRGSSGASKKFDQRKIQIGSDIASSVKEVIKQKAAFIPETQFAPGTVESVTGMIVNQPTSELEISAVDAAKILNSYGVNNVKADKGKLLFDTGKRNKNNERIFQIIKAFDNNKNIYGVLEAYRFTLPASEKNEIDDIAELLQLYVKPSIDEFEEYKVKED